MLSVLIPRFLRPGSPARLQDESLDEQLRRPNQALQSIISLVPGHVWTALPDGCIEYLSPSLREYTGKNDTHDCEFFQAVTHPDDLQANERYWHLLRAGHDPGELEFRLRHTDGSYRWFLSRVKAVRNNSGQPLRWVGASWDIHDRKIAESLLRTEEETYRRIVDSVPACVCVGGPTGELLYVNKVGVAELGKPMEDILGDRWMEYIHPDDVRAVRQQWQTRIAAGEPVDIVARMRQQDGTYHWQHLLAEPSRRSNTGVVNWYLIGIDIDDLHKSNAALQQREYQLQKLAETIPAMLWCNNPQGKLTYVNQKTSEFLGRGIADLVDLGYQGSIHPEDLSGVMRSWARSIETGEPYNHVARLLRKDGAYRWHRHTAEAMRDPYGNIVQWYGLSLDIDEPKRAEDRLRQAKAELARATQIATVAELSASIAHELNQPLTSIIANAQACKRWLAASPPNLNEARTSVESVVRDARSADQTMQSIRALFKRQSIQKRRRNVRDMVLEAVRLLREDETRRTADIEFDLPDGLPPVFVDQIQIQQVLLNLITNGIEAAEDSGRPPRIRIAASPLDDRFVLLEVIDNGSGIVDGDTIFDAFFTTKSKGMGIGLAVSRSIIEAHEGRLTAANNSGHGATFSVVLPVLPVPASH